MVPIAVQDLENAPTTTMNPSYLPTRASMRGFLAVVIVMASAVGPAWGQGTVLFANRVTGVIDAPVVFPGIATDILPADSRFLAQLFGAAPGGNLAPIGNPVPFGEEPGWAPGYIRPVEHQIPGVAPGGSAQVKMVAWYRQLGNSYVEALNRGMGGVGESAVITIDSTGGGLQPPALLSGLSGFHISIILSINTRPNPIVPAGFPNNPSQVAQIRDFYPSLEPVEGIVVQNESAFVASGLGGLRIFDISNPLAPRTASYLQFSGEAAIEIDIHGNHAYVATFSSSPPNPIAVLQIVDVTIPTQPQSKARLPLYGQPSSVAVLGDGRHVLVTAQGAGLFVVHVEDPAAPRVVGQYALAEQALGVSADGNQVCIADAAAGLHILDLSNPAQPRRLGLYGAPGAVDVSSRGSLAFVSVGSGGLHAVDLSDPTNPRLLGSATLTGGAGSSILRDRHLYVGNDAVSFDKPDALSVVDISDPRNLRLVGRTTVARHARDFAIAKDRLWVADSLLVTSFPLGPHLSIARDLGVQLTGILGQPYRIEEQFPDRVPPTWSLIREAPGTGVPENIPLPPAPDASSRLIRATAVPFP